MASGQQRAERDTREKQGEGNQHRRGQTKGEHLGVKGYQREEMDRNGGASPSKKEQPGTEGRNEMGRRGPAGGPAVGEGIDVDESTG